ncbi:hypothetical protein GGR22_002714 [Flavobacterium gossypii]|uniref:Four helix bundle protein n=1 Tax=Flavobacterium gossypii TaxID=1646119 RepID=A0ABR6DTF2_9FLAO|nr:hypothetical protein [Flavobacterium gossypii]MBA9074541.1 hypothetical protein [Flavobacterium gossypii]
MSDTTKKPATIVGRIMYKIKIFAKRYYKYPYPEEAFFKDIAEKTVCDAHSNCEKEVFTKQKVLLLWLYVKSQALKYIIMVQCEMKEKFVNPAQKLFYAQKIGTDVAHIDEKLESLKLQFSDSEDIMKK